MMILCITPDHEVFRLSDAPITERRMLQLQKLYNEDCAILRVTPPLDAKGGIEVEEWIGEDEEVPAVGWTRVEYRSPSIE